MLEGQRPPVETKELGMDDKAIAYVGRLAVLGLLAGWFAYYDWDIAAAVLLFLLAIHL